MEESARGHLRRDQPFLRGPDRVGRRKNSIGSTARTSANFPMISSPNVGHRPPDPAHVDWVHPNVVGKPLLR